MYTFNPNLCPFLNTQNTHICSFLQNLGQTYTGHDNKMDTTNTLWTNVKILKQSSKHYHKVLHITPMGCYSLLYNLFHNLNWLICFIRLTEFLIAYFSPPCSAKISSFTYSLPLIFHTIMQYLLIAVVLMEEWEQ